MLSVTRMELDSNLPIVGCELTPKMYVSLTSDTVSTDDVLNSVPIEGQFLRYTWYRIESDANAIPCNVHPSEPTTIQCDKCGNSKRFVAQSNHCSPKCYQDAWLSHHKAAHEESLRLGEKDMILPNHVWVGRRLRYQNTDPSFNPKRWMIGHTRTYTPTTKDIGYFLKLECDVICAVTFEDLKRSRTLETSRVVPLPTPFPRNLVPVIGVDVRGKSKPFTVLTYNILSDTSASDKQYGYCQPWARTWTYRKHNLLQEIVGYNADVVCLQEVQNSHLNGFLAPELIRLGYDFRYQRRTDKLDGCATFFKQNKFSFVKDYCIEFDKIAQPFVGVDTLASQRLIQNNIALIAVLQFVDPSGNLQQICVANTRLEVQLVLEGVKQDLKDVMLWQVYRLLKGMSTIAEYSKGIPMIMCGDFNMTPESVPHLLVVTGKVDPSHQDLKYDPNGILQPLAELAHDLPLVSAYSAFSRLPTDAMFAKHKMSVNSSSVEPLFTKCSKEFTGCHDYIFYTANNLSVEGLLELVEQKEVVKNVALPSPQWPSSHIALLAQFSCIPTYK
ncbi:Carbon catabolite repressor-like protein [Cardamine amara subsp. amara]|uniref:Carbon catabolite repressor-like protein n=1 Tax=Cardamine amara subsp. amara TaxID=228776 RepID=A0ABD0Z023_CARAN